MKKGTKILVCAACVAMLGTGSLFAKGRDGMGGKGGHDGFGKMYRTTDAAGNIVAVRPNTLMGQVKSVDENTGTVKLADLDGREIVITVNPFTRIRLDDSTSDKTISDIKAGNWVMYSLYNTETQVKVADRIVVKSK